MSKKVDFFDENIKEKAISIVEEEISKNDFSSISFLSSLASIIYFKEDLFDKYSKLIKKIIKNYDSNFDEDYLLVYRLESGRKVFYELDNRVLLDFGRVLVEILEKNESISELDVLNLFLSKVELGYERYFLYGKRIVEKFCPSERIFEMKGEVSFNFYDFFPKSFDITKKKSGIIKKDFDFFLNFLIFFPEKVYSKENFFLLEIEKSLFFEVDFKEVKFKRELYYVSNLNNSVIASKYLLLYKNEGRD